MAGYVKIPRDLFEDSSLTSVRFPRPWAMIDLIQMAKFKESQECVNGKYITLKRGQLCKSIRQLANRWGWNERTVMRFLDSLVSTTMITLSVQHASNIISINNYDQYNDEYNTDGCKSTTPNNIINNKNNIPPLSKERVSPLKGGTPLEDRQKSFYDSLIPFVNKYGKEMVRDFYNYWSEPDRAAKPKMRFEKEKTWSLERRLETWNRNEAKFGSRTVKSKGERMWDNIKKNLEVLPFNEDGTINI